MGDQTRIAHATMTQSMVWARQYQHAHYAFFDA
jgi:hypothetical protein